MLFSRDWDNVMHVRYEKDGIYYSESACRSVIRKVQNEKCKKFENRVAADYRYDVFKLHLCPPL